MTTTWITCSGCDAQWTAAGAAHCSGCHESFSGISTFDLHRSMVGDRGTCRRPADITTSVGERSLWFRDGMWRHPEMSEEDKAARFGSKDRSS